MSVTGLFSRKDTENEILKYVMNKSLENPVKNLVKFLEKL